MAFMSLSSRVLLIIACSVSFISGQKIVVPTDVVSAANNDFKSFLTSTVSEENKTLIGFDKNDNLQNAVLGTPFKIFILTDEAIKNYADGTDLQSVLKETDMWYFPIIIKDSIKMILYVGKRNGVWERAGIGSANLGREMQKITDKWNPGDGYYPCLIVQNTIGNYLFTIPQVNNHNLTEVGEYSNPDALRKSSSDPVLNDVDKAMHALKTRISGNR